METDDARKTDLERLDDKIAAADVALDTADIKLEDAEKAYGAAVDFLETLRAKRRGVTDGNK
jgi:hypothetical protein